MRVQARGMHDLMYASSSITTTDAVADALLGYAAQLAGLNRVDVVTVPVIHEGRPAMCRILIGAAIPLAATQTSGHEADLPGAMEAMLDLSRRRNANSVDS
jgi:hypothetical protein